MEKKKKSFYMVNKEKHDSVINNKLLTNSYRLLYFVLCKKNNELTNDKRDFFYRSITDLHKDSGLSRQIIVDGLKQLNKLKVIKTWQAPRNTNGKNFKETITYIQIL